MGLLKNIHDLTTAQATALWDKFVGDSGSGGLKGLVPPPSAGDAAANKFLRADAVWATTAFGGVDRGGGVFVETPTGKTYTIIGYAPSAGTINGVWVKTRAGTLTADLQINGVSVTSLNALAVTSVGAFYLATGANTFLSGARITVIVSTIVSAADFELAMDIT